MAGRLDMWGRVAAVSHVVLTVASALVVVAMAQAGSSTAVLGLVVLAAVTLHLALSVAARRAARAFVIASAAMVVLAVVPMPGWSTGVLLPSAVCFLLVSWQLVTAAAPPWPILALAVGVIGVVLAEGLAIVRLAGSAVESLQLLEALALLAIVVGVWAAARRTRRLREEREAAEHARITAARMAERANIRRDLHDVIGHTLALMVAQAEAARIGVREDATREAIGQIAETGRGALAGLRTMLRVLDATSTGTSPVPSLESLPSLVEAASTPLHTVTFVEAGARGVVAADAELALVRVAQEGITNALRHVVAPMVVDVRLTWAPGSAALEVHDDGGAGLRPGSGSGSGSGLVALAERATSAGGAFDVEQDPAGWCLRVTVPAGTGSAAETGP
jgi:signal transduction histidine kinase